jgi:CDP-diacylglycerol--glycerol-3-phosphate 3-phosphatidyltransferase
MGLANRITLARGVVTVVLWVVLHAITRSDPTQTGLWWLAFGLFVLAAATDSLDGYVARKRGEVSVFGRIADPLVDKLLILGSAIFLLAIPGVPDRFPPWVAALILLREMLITALRAQIEAGGGNFQAGPWGKAKMALQCVAIGAVFLAGADFPLTRSRLWDLTGPVAGPGEVTLPWLISIVAAVVTAASGVEYCLRAVPLLRNPPPRA